jgi:hypothetical protein
MSAIARSALCVTEGDVSSAGASALAVESPKMRAYINQPSADSAQIHFRYLGPTASQSALGSGATLVQFGLKLRAADACNLIYVMWRIEPTLKLVVSVKSNPGQHSSSQCSNHGYQNIKPRSSVPAPQLAAGQSHTLRARLQADELAAFIDDRLVWQGALGPIASGLTGPAGVRSDNARLEFDLKSDHAPASSSSALAGCRTGPEESE